MFAGDGSAPEPSGAVSDLLVPAAGAWFGASPSTIGSNGISASGLAAWVAGAGLRPHIIALYKTGAWSGVFSGTEEDYFDPPSGDTTHAIPHVRWKPNTGGATWADVAAGDLDADIATMCTGISAYGRKMFMSFHHEPENDSGAAGFSEADYVAMWQHIRGEFDANGVTNCVYVMNYSGYSGGAVDSSGSGFEAFYPGDAYCDWIGFDLYTGQFSPRGDSWGNFVNENTVSISGWTGFYDWSVADHPSKPLMICEWGVGIDIPNATNGMTEAQQATVLENFAVDVADYPQIRGVQYWHSQGLRDYQITDKATANVDALVALVNLPWFTQDPDLAP